MPRKRLPSTTGKSLTDPPPYFLHPLLPPPNDHPSQPTENFLHTYNIMEVAGSRFLHRLQATVAPTLGRRSLSLAYNADARKSKSPKEAIELPIQKTLGIGSVRMVYYRELVYGQYYQSMSEDSYLAGTSFFVVDGKRRDPMEWLTMDRFLARTLMSLGLSWWGVEGAIAKGLLNSGLPQEFMSKYGADPATSDFVATWEEIWSNRDAFQAYGNASRKFRANARRFTGEGKFAENVEAVLRGEENDLRTEGEVAFDADGQPVIPLDDMGKLIIPSSAEDRVLNEILIPGISTSKAVEQTGSAKQHLSGEVMRDYGIHKILLNSRDLTGDWTENYAAYTTSRRSPFINSIVYELGHYLWNGISIKHRSNPPVSAAARRLVARKVAWLEQGDTELRYFLPTEFFMLVTDILYHCPVARGLPDAHLIHGSIGPSENNKPLSSNPEEWSPIHPPLPMWNGLTADQVRQRFGEADQAERLKKPKNWKFQRPKP